MAREIPPLDLDDIISRYQGGEGIDKIAPGVGVSVSYLYKRLSAIGALRSVKEASHARKYVDPDWITTAVELHLAGVSQSEIVRQVNRAQPTISKALLRRGYRTDRGEAERRKWAAMTTRQRAAQVAAAHVASTGRVLASIEMERRAATKQDRESHATDEERRIAALIGDDAVLQQAVGKYNLDIGAFPVAVELFGGGWHAHGRHLARLPHRMMDLADAGWNVLIVWTHVVHPLDYRVVADETLAYLERSRLDPSFRRQYRVIWSDGEFIAAGCVDDDKLTFVPTGIRGTYARRR